jgi:hypothetical protein
MHNFIHTVIRYLAKTYNKIEEYWEGDKNHRIIGSLILLVFVGSLGLIYLNRLGFIHTSFSNYIPTKYFSAIVNAFWALLIFEIFSLIFVFPGSVSSSMVKQFEIFSLILLRDVFKSIESFPEPIVWDSLVQSFYPMAFDAFGALLVFIGIFHIKNLQLHKSITNNKEKLHQFVEIKKVMSLMLIFIFIGIALYDAYLFSVHAPVFQMFTMFYTVMIFFDVAIVLISLRYNLSFVVLFRYSAFTVATILLRFSLSAPPLYKALLGVSSVIFILLLTYYYSKFMKNSPEKDNLS